MIFKRGKVLRAEGGKNYGNFSVIQIELGSGGGRNFLVTPLTTPPLN